MSKRLFDQGDAGIGLATLLEILELVPLEIVVEQLEQDFRADQRITEMFLAQLSQTYPSTTLPSSPSKKPLSIMIAYASNDARFIPKIEQILMALQQQGYTVGWKFTEIHLNQQWKKLRIEYLSDVDLLLLLITPAFLATLYCYCDHLKWAITMHQKKTYVMPVLLQACLWDEAPFAILPSITPTNQKAVDEWSKATHALRAVAKDIREAIRYLQSRQ